MLFTTGAVMSAIRQMAVTGQRNAHCHTASAPALAKPEGLPELAGVAGEHAMYGDLAEGAQAHVIAGVVADVLSEDGLKSDRIHPNREGYARMAQAAFTVLGRCR